MNIARFALICMTVSLVACAPQTYKKPPYNQPSDDATIKLAEAARDISHSMAEVARVEKVVVPHNKDNVLTIPNTYDLQARASIDWAGPIVELTRRLAKSAHYRTRVLGKPPVLPVLVSVNVQDESIAELLRDIDYQAGKKASIHVYPKNRVVELRYDNQHG